MALSAFDRWLSAEPEERCPECGWLGENDSDLPEDERHICDPNEVEPPEVGDPDPDW